MDQLGFNAARTPPDQVEFLPGVNTTGSNSDCKPWHNRASVSAIVGGTLTDRLRGSSAERRFLAGPQVGISIQRQFPVQINAIYSPIGRNVTWEFPVLVRYTESSPLWSSAISCRCLWASLSSARAGSWGSFVWRSRGSWEAQCSLSSLDIINQQAGFL